MITNANKMEPYYLDLRALLKSLTEKKLFIATFTAVTCLLALSYALTRPTLYQTHLLLKIQTMQPEHLRGNALPSHRYSDDSIAVQTALLKSDFILHPVVKTLGLDIQVTPYRSFLSRFIKKNNTPIQVSELNIPNTPENKKLHLQLDSEQHFRLYNMNDDLLLEGKTAKLIKNNEMSVRIDAPDAPLGSQFYLTLLPESTVIAALRSHLLITDLSSANEPNPSTAILQLSLSGTEPRLITAILNTIATITQQKSMAIKAMEAEKHLSFLKQQLPLLQSSLKNAEAKLNAYRAKSGRIDVKLQTEYLLTHISDIDKELERIRIQHISMLQQYTAQHPFVLALEQERLELENQRSELSNQLRKLPAADQEAANLMRDVNVKNNLYMMLLNQIHQAQVMQAGLISNIEILNQATVPTITLPIKFGVLLFFSIGIGMMLSCIAVLSWKILVPLVNDPHWIETRWNIKNLAVIPFSKIQASRDESPFTTYPLPLLAHQYPHDVAIESLCNLRTFLKMHIKPYPENIITLLGIAKDSGKTFIAVNLASLLARMGNRVLVIDADIRNGHMHTYFKPHLGLGLTDLILGKTTLEHVLIQATHLPNLEFLPRGTKAERPSDLLLSSELKPLLHDLSKQYDYVIINTSPNLFTSDSLLISTCAFMNLLVLGANRHEAFEIDLAIRNWQHAGIVLHGCIMNHLKTGKENNKYDALLRQHTYSTSATILPLKNSG